MLRVHMKRRHWIEISDEPWCPQSIRRASTDYCRFVTELSGIYNVVAPLLVESLQRTGDRRILDLGSGAAGPWIGLLKRLRHMGVDVAVCLSDHNPDLEAFERARRLSQQAITYHAEPVDATEVPNALPGFRTFFSAFHHLRPDQARAVLALAVAQGEGIAVFECGQRSVLEFLLLIGTPIRVLLMTPFILPFRWSRLLWTYLVPVMPIVLLFDSVVSCLRMYSVNELRDLTTGLDDVYHWRAGTVPARPIPVPVTYLIGVPIS
jgi:SAM-dependent methyltransferase